MEAMILAAGAGTRLRPLTDRVPKALVEVGGRPLLGWVMDRLVGAGVTHLIVNTHYHEEQIRTYLEVHAPPGVAITISAEPDGPYDTGGGLFAARPLFVEDAPFLLHNVDVLSRIPLEALLTEHQAATETSGRRVVASLAVQARESERMLLFDDLGLMGWENGEASRASREWRSVRAPVGELTRRSFTGIHVVDPTLFSASDRKGSFSIITLYLELAARGHVISPIDVSDHEWIDVGTHEQLAKGGRTVGR